MNVQDLRAAVLSGQRFSYLLFWGHRPGLRLGPTCLSQWFVAPFEEDGVRYRTAEHYMMAGKARLFGDDEALEAILEEPEPGKVKRWGRRVRGFKGSVWDAERFEIVTRGNVAKFGHDPRMRAFLLNTGDKVLVEASPQDRIWGIGMSAKDERAENPLEWQGKNLLGFALMAARERLRVAG